MRAHLTDFSCPVNTFCPPLREPYFHRMFGFRSPIFDFHCSLHSQKERVAIESRVETMMSDDITLLSAPSLLESR